jgi:hypothetical protein
VESDRQGAEEHGGADLTVLNLSGFEAKPMDTSNFADKLLGPISSAFEAVEKAFRGTYVDEIKRSLAITAEGNIGVASAGVESSIEVTFKWRENRDPVKEALATHHAT